MSNKRLVLATSDGLYYVGEDGKTKECPVNEDFELDEKQAKIFVKTGKMQFVTNKKK